MPIAQFLGPFTPVPLRGAGHVAQTAVELPFTMQTQLQSLWCWAAVTASVCSFLGDISDNTDQCKLATRFLHIDCCLDPLPAYCTDWPGNHVYALSGSLSDLNHADDEPCGKLDFESIAGQIDQQKPVCCHIGYDPMDGHFVTIIGYDRNGQKIIVLDPDGVSPHNGTFVISQFDAAVGGRWDQSILIK